MRKTTPSAFVYSELGVFPLIHRRLQRILKFWFKILRLKDSNPVKIIYNTLVKDMEDIENVTNWASLLKGLLDKFGFGNIWLQQHVHNERRLLFNITLRIKDNSIFTK